MFNILKTYLYFSIRKEQKYAIKSGTSKFCSIVAGNALTNRYIHEMSIREIYEEFYELVIMEYNKKFSAIYLSVDPYVDISSEKSAKRITVKRNRLNG